MKGEKDSLRGTGYTIGLFFGIISSVLFIYILNTSGLIAISSSGGIDLVITLRWLYENLRLSIIPFSLAAAGYLFYLNKLVRLLDSENPIAREIYATEEKIELLINVFLGIGVIWTAIGMRNALLASLGNIDAEIAAQKGAFYILTQLVDGGILLALSTTIAGGLGGYAMRMVKAWSTGAQFNTFIEFQLDTQRQEVLDKLDRIASFVERTHTEINHVEP